MFLKALELFEFERSKFKMHIGLKHTLLIYLFFIVLPSAFHTLSAQDNDAYVGPDPRIAKPNKAGLPNPLVSPLHSIWTNQVGDAYTEGFCICNSPEHITYTGGDRLIKIDESGKQIWMKTWPATQGLRIEGIAADFNNNVYCAGHFNGNILKFDSLTLRGRGTSSGFIAKYSPAGKIIWALVIASDLKVTAKALTLAPKGAVYVAGQFTGKTLKIGEGSNPNSTAQGKGGSDIFVLKVDPLGHTQWLKTYGSKGDEEATAITTDIENRVYIAGTFSGPKLGFGQDSLQKPHPMDKSTQFFLLKLDKIGGQLWATTQPELPQSSVRALITDTMSNVYMLGQYVPDGDRELQNYLVRINDQGKMEWAKKVRPRQEADVQAMVFSKRGGVVVTGTYQDTTYAGGRVATFVAGYDVKGTATWISTLGVETQWQAKSIAADNAGCVYLCGNAFESQHPYFSTRLGIPNSIGNIGHSRSQRTGGGFEKGEY